MTNPRPGRSHDFHEVLPIRGVGVGHWTSDDGGTGCTVVVFPDGAVASGEVRGGAPATREFALLDPSRMMQRVDAVVLSGGSAFGLATADGVMHGLAEAGRGFPTVGGVVPIVVGMCIYDLVATGRADRPDANAGRMACDAALQHEGGTEAVAFGRVGAGAGATYRKWWGRAASRPGGIGMATVRHGDATMTAIVVVNALGDVDPGDGSMLDMPPPRVQVATHDEPEFGVNTTIGVIITNAKVDKSGCHLLSQGGHDGMARALVPSHTAADGDALVAVATGEVDTDPVHLKVMATEAVARAIRSVASP